jgi:hypothetical protein
MSRASAPTMRPMKIAPTIVPIIWIGYPLRPISRMV